ncbi:helix-turn-helix domain-containing protein [Halomarina halobia]|uniref:Helix-turn-helix domain-containing protein n=1 Tax=Halomarina halobia TaxID=3033386 RepID=A0ABD6A7Y0_9EURY|nr:helix-turn-helix domain-containing protein [Halomarina sp. PSR21]
MAQSQPTPPAPSIEQLRTVVELIETPVLARVYAYVLHAGPTTVADLVEQVDVPQGTAYDYVRKLEGADLLTKTAEKRPYEYVAEDVSLTLSSDGQTRTITPELIEAVARRTADDDIDLYIERHGIDGLATALDYAHEYVDGTVNHRIATRELDCSPLEAEVILQALEPVVLAYRDDE